jgi:60 kDa SS-A/Ro ribonucleoprotein
MLRLGHPKAPSGDHQSIFSYIVKGPEKGGDFDLNSVPEALGLIGAFEKAKKLNPKTDLKEMVKLIQDYRLPHECVPNGFKKNPEIWDAMLQSMPPAAMLRNLNKMTSVGLLTNMSDATKKVTALFNSKDALKNARLHPMSILLGMKAYATGRGIKGNMTWDPVGRVIDALDAGFYNAFASVKPTGKRICLALDVSGSMMHDVNGAPNISCREAAAAMALVTMNTEPTWEILGYTCDGAKPYQDGTVQVGWGRKEHKQGISRLSLSPRQRLDDACKSIKDLEFGGTDCALPILWAMREKQEFDAFISFTDNETWAGSVQPTQALQRYRDKTGIPAKLICVAFSAAKYSVADPTDAGQMDVAGMDASVPTVISNFIRD